MNEEVLTSMSRQQPGALNLSLGPCTLDSRLLSGNPEPPQGPDLKPLEVSSNKTAAECPEQPKCSPTREHKVNSRAILRPAKPSSPASHPGYSPPQWYPCGFSHAQVTALCGFLFLVQSPASPPPPFPYQTLNFPLSSMNFCFFTASLFQWMFLPSSAFIETWALKTPFPLYPMHLRIPHTLSVLHLCFQDTSISSLFKKKKPVHRSCYPEILLLTPTCCSHLLPAPSPRFSSQDILSNQASKAVHMGLEFQFYPNYKAHSQHS